MSAPLAMRRKSDGRLMPYSKTLVAANPGAFVAARLEDGKWVDGAPLAELPVTPVPAAKVSPTDGVGKAAPARVEIEPDTAASTARKAKAKASKGAEA